MIDDAPSTPDVVVSHVSPPCEEVDDDRCPTENSSQATSSLLLKEPKPSSLHHPDSEEVSTPQHKPALPGFPRAPHSEYII